MSEPVVYLNGRIVPAGQAAVSAFDSGFLHGVSVFTTLRAHNGRPFRLDRHLRRLSADAGRIGLRHEATAEELAGAVDEILRANALTEARVRITLTPGRPGAAPESTTLVTASETGIQAGWYEKGIGAIVNQVRQYEHDPLGGAKTGCYLPRVLARQAAAAAGADEALWFTHSGRLAEACFCNVFLVGDGGLATPPLDTPVLPGIVREAVLELTARLDLTCRDDEPIGYDDVLACREMFLTSSVAGVRPVVRLDRRPIGDEAPGPVTRSILAAYARLLEEECPPPGA